MNKNLNKIKQFAKKIKLEYVIAFTAVIAILLIFFGNISGENSVSTIAVSEVDEYVAMLEAKLSKRLSEIDGAGKVSVIISVKKGVYTEIATEKITTTGISGEKVEETPILVSGKPIILNEIYPEICGVLIVAKGASDIKVKMSLLSATQIFLDVTSDKIQILTMK